VQPVGIQAIEYYLPVNTRETDELVKNLDFDRSFLNDKVGIRCRHIAAPEEAASDLAVSAAQKIFQNTDLAADQIGLVLVCTQSPDYQLPHTAALVQNNLGIPSSVASFDINLGCSGYVYALALAKSFMEAQGISDGLVITSEIYSRIMDPQDRGTVAVFGDAAAATWVRSGAPWIVEAFDFGTDGGGYNNLIREAGGSRNPLPSLDANPCLYMNGREIFNFMMKKVPISVRNCLEKKGLNIEEVDQFVFHQASQYMLEALRKRLRIKEEKMMVYLKEVGNTVSSTIPIALNELWKRPDRPKTILISGFGVGLSWATALLSRNPATF
jgi:3-oxoacyl-[acyl-carrier-protein] synthase-3